MDQRGIRVRGKLSSSACPFENGDHARALLFDEGRSKAACHLRLVREVGEQAGNGFGSRRPRQRLEDALGQASEIPLQGSGVARRRQLRAVDGAREHKLRLRPPATVDGGLADARARGDRLDGESGVSDLLEQLTGSPPYGVVDPRLSRTAAWCIARADVI